MAKFTLASADPITVATPVAGQITVFADSTDSNKPKYKTSDGIIHEFGVGEWKKYTIDFDDAGFSTGTANPVIEIESSLSAGSVILFIKKKHSASFIGGSISVANISVGYNSEFDDVLDVFQAPADTVGILRSPDYSTIGDQASPSTIDLKLDLTGGIDTDLTQGSVDIWIKTIILI